MNNPNHPNAASRKRRRRRLQKIAKQTAASATEQQIKTAIAYYESGDLETAKSIFCEIIETDPLNLDAWHFLGVVFLSAGEYPTAFECLTKANQIQPNHAAVLANLGLVYRGFGDLPNAESVLRQAVALDPNASSHRTNLATVLFEQQKFESAAEEFESVLAVDPTNEMAVMNLANLHQAQGRFRDAETMYRRILSQASDRPLVWNNLGETLNHLGRISEAIEALQQAVTLAPSLIEPQVNLARCLSSLHRHHDARQCLERIIDQHPECAKAHHYLGKSYFDTDDMENARHAIERSIELDPQDTFARSALGFVLLEMGQPEMAETVFREALSNDPSHIAAHSALLFLLSGKYDITPQQLFREHLTWAKQFDAIVPFEAYDNDPSPNRRLRIGYVSPDLRRHAVADFFRPVLAAHDSANFETFCYAEVDSPDEMTNTLQSLADHWRYTIGLSDAQVAQQVREDQIDILVDLAGHTTNNRLGTFAYHPAPRSVTWLGYPNTTGLAAMDYRLTCDVQNPSGEPSFHSEKLVPMTLGSFCYDGFKTAPEIAAPPITKNGYVTFGALHRPFKITPVTLDLWAGVLQESTTAKLLLFNSRFTEQSADQILTEMSNRGIAKQRIEIRNHTDEETYLTTYDEIDIALDVTPWAGSTTTLEALWMGVPVVGFYGTSRSARSTAAILNRVRLKDLIATSQSDYVRLAIELGTDVSRLESLRLTLRDTLQETVCDADRFTSELEQIFRDLWKQWCTTQAD